MRNPRRSHRPPLIALGAMTFGGQTDEQNAARMLDMFLDEGHSWVDTAYMYTDGRSEEILGRLLRGARRKKVYLATKAYPDKLGPGRPPGLTPGSIRGQIETSLQRLRMDGVDLFYLHAPDNKTPLEVSLGVCQDLIAEGKTRDIGLSNYASWQVAEAVGICLRNGWPLPVVYQGMYNALTRDIERECIVACRHFGLKFLAYNPLAGGLLTGNHAAPEAVPEKGRFSAANYRERFWKAAYFEAVEMLRPAAERAKVALADAALRWVLHHSLADGVLLGASKVEHLEQNLAATRRGPLPRALVRALDNAWEHTRPVCQRYFRD